MHIASFLGETPASPQLLLNVFQVTHLLTNNLAGFTAMVHERLCTHNVSQGHLRMLFAYIL